jgi:hypothetical protein
MTILLQLSAITYHHHQGSLFYSAGERGGQRTETSRLQQVPCPPSSIQKPTAKLQTQQPTTSKETKTLQQEITLPKTLDVSKDILTISNIKENFQAEKIKN